MAPKSKRPSARRVTPPSELLPALYVRLPVDVHEKIHALAKADTGSTITRWLTLLVRSLPDARPVKRAVAR